MSTTRRLLPAVAISGSTLMVGCGGSGYPYYGSCGYYGSYGSFGTCYAYGPYVPGVYQGTMSAGPQGHATAAVAVFAEGGPGLISTTDGAYYRLAVGPQGKALTGHYLAYSNVSVLADAAASDAGTVKVAKTSAGGLSAQLKDQAGQPQSLALSFDSVYSQPSSLQTVAGTWNYNLNGYAMTLAIQPNGTLSGNDSNGCSYTGTLSLIDSATNAYHLTYSRACGNVASSFSGAAVYFPASGPSAPAYLQVMADDGQGNYLAAPFQA